MEFRNIAILGAGGNVGSAIITELLKDGSRFTITAVTRQSSKYTPPPGSGIQHKRVDYDSIDSLIEALSGQEAIVNCITGGATQYEPSKRIVDAAVSAGVKFFFANEFVASLESEQFKRLPESHAGAKLRVRRYLQQLSDAGSITWTSLNGGPFFDMWVMKGPAGFDISKRQARIYGSGNNPLCWTPVPTMGLAAANMLRNPKAFANRSVYVSPIPQLTQNIILATLEAVLETKFTVENIDVKKINEHAKIALERGEAAKAMKGLAISNQFYEGDSGNDFSHLAENELLGVQTMTVEEAVRDAIARYGVDGPVVEAMFNVNPCEI